ncbi:MAG: hypothetical protein HOV77_25045 [Hamadaea sp.]|uniref:hypothetical protein n=1 Tax=Hamadaea sp. TaxID=2024425 RepID=UPI00185A5CE9|nr:hypothetical protein [Hamadaea sp.]NUT22453.1 hypothetical protein [Hamadaea sp.]
MRRSYLLCAVKVDPASLDATRRALRRLCLPSQRRLHFEREQDARRRHLLDQITKLRIQATVYQCDDPNQIAARMGCLRQLLVDESTAMTRLVLDACETMDHRDRRLIYLAARDIGMAPTFTYEHLRSFEEPLLWVSDAVAWAVGAGRSWHTRVTDVVAVVVEVKPDFTVR